MNKHQKYINYIVNDIELPYFKNMKEMYGLSDNEMEYVLSKLYDGSIRIMAKMIYDTNGNVIYFENSNGFWVKREFDDNGNETYYGDSRGFWYKKEFDGNGNLIHYVNSKGYWIKREYDQYGSEIYFENSDGTIRDYR